MLLVYCMQKLNRWNPIAGAIVIGDGLTPGKNVVCIRRRWRRRGDPSVALGVAAMGKTAPGASATRKKIESGPSLPPPRRHSFCDM